MSYDPLHRPCLICQRGPLIYSVLASVVALVLIAGGCAGPPPPDLQPRVDELQAQVEVLDGSLVDVRALLAERDRELGTLNAGATQLTRELEDCWRQRNEARAGAKRLRAALAAAQAVARIEAHSRASLEAQLDYQRLEAYCRHQGIEGQLVVASLAAGCVVVPRDPR